MNRVHSALLVESAKRTLTVACIVTRLILHGFLHYLWSVILCSIKCKQIQNKRTPISGRCFFQKELVFALFVLQSARSAFPWWMRLYSTQNHNAFEAFKQLQWNFFVLLSLSPFCLRILWRCFWSETWLCRAWLAVVISNIDNSAVSKEHGSKTNNLFSWDKHFLCMNEICDPRFRNTLDLHFRQF